MNRTEDTSLNSEQQALQQALRDGLNRRLAGLDEDSLERLRQSRQSALQALPQARSGGWVSDWLSGLNRGLDWQPLPLAAALALLAVLLVPLQLDLPPRPMFPPTDAAILALGADEFDYIDELEFGLWLDQAALATAMPE
ncbi:MAG: DUF3510 domain-containing protein [Gammaproteobacteria bacterium SHHR-1]|uniref:hypothetical protein n=1 Tax=Magnetovirga frankeli TaxID=947516 RepID=UPI0012938BC3|nr:hypothetical protein D5125_16755 [gamma proteobacterium SS-5]